MSRSRSLFAVSIVVVVVLLCVGCSSQPVSGVVERQPALTKGTIVPDISFTTADGKQTALSAVRHPITIVGFVKAPGGGCCQVDPELADLSAKFRRLPGSVVQVIVPQGTNRSHPDDIRMPDVKRPDPVVLYDQDQVVWNGYGRPEPGTLVLINKYGAIIEVSNMKNRGPLIQKAIILAMDEMDDPTD